MENQQQESQPIQNQPTIHNQPAERKPDMRLVFFAVAAVIVLMLLIVGFGVYDWYLEEGNCFLQQPVLCSDGLKQVCFAGKWRCVEEINSCTMEAKLCPDGSSVGRSGPNCEFAPCPSEASCEGGACPSATTDATADWQTYQNEELGFEFKYPENWIVQTGQEIFSPTFFGLDFTIPTNTSTDSDYPMVVQPSFAVSIIDNPSGLDLQQWMKAEEKKDSEASKVEITYEIVKEQLIDVYKSLEVKEPCYGDDCFIFWISKSPYIYEFNGSNLGETFNQILSTFKFIK